MYQVQDGYSQYKEIDLAARTAAASPLELVLVLFSGLMDELERAKSHIEGRRSRRKPRASINASTFSMRSPVRWSLKLAASWWSTFRDSMTTAFTDCMRPAANCRRENR
ncbi:lateral flagellar chaperone protein (FliS-like) [Escherichia coli]|nr:lateral flagellar chaperone protein (FliS-like) [Escherichia coli]